MDVRCARCSTDYEFDDALIAERGTTVRCTQCGHQFRIFPPQATRLGPDEWVVMTALGDRVVYRTLRALQNGITRGEVAREDLLSRGSRPPRPLGSIAELDPFFVTHGSDDRDPSTLMGVAPPTNEVVPGAHRTWTGVAPPANAPPEFEEAPVESGFDRGPTKNTNAGVAPPANPPPELEAGLVAATAPVLRSQPVVVPAVDHGPLSPGAAAEDRPQAKPVFVVQARRGHDTVIGVGDPQEATAPIPVVARKSERPAAAKGAISSILPDSTDRGWDEVEALVPPRTAESSSAQQEASPEVPPNASPHHVHRSTWTVPGISAPPRPTPSGAPSPTRAGLDSAVSPTPAVVSPVAEPGHPASPSGPALAESVPRSLAAALARVDLESQDARAESTAALLRDSEPSASVPARDRTLLSEGPLPPVDETVMSAVPTPRVVGPRLPDSPQAQVPATEEPASPQPSAAIAAPEPMPSESALAPSPSAEPARAQPVVMAGREATGQNLVQTLAPPRRSFGLVRVLTIALLCGLGSFALVMLLQKRGNLGPSSPTNPSASSDGSTAAAPVASADELQTVVRLLDSGDIMAARDRLDRIEPAVTRSAEGLVQRARADVMWADLAWLALRLADPKDKARQRELLNQRTERIGRATASLQAASQLPAMVGRLAPLRVDLERISGDLGQARSLAQSLGSDSSEPAVALTLGLLGAAAETPAWSQVIEQLGRARASDSGLGRAPAAMVEALVRAGRLEQARAELDRLANASAVHPLLDDLRGFLGRSVAADAPSQANLADAGVAPDAAVAPQVSEELLLTGDFRTRMVRGHEELRQGRFDNAYKLFRSVTAERPQDTEALTGLADVARRRGDAAGSLSLYEKILAANPQYLPALSAAADLKWRLGDRDGALVQYRRILDLDGEEGVYGAKAKTRLLSSSPQPVNEGAKDSPAVPASPSTGPAIDTRDLPEYRQ